MKKIAVVTGASSGMGADFARQLDALGGLDEIWVVARRRDRLESLVKELKNARGVIVEADLSAEAGLAILRDKLAAEKPELRWLVNNAGYGKLGAFAATPRAETLGMIDLNIRALTALSYDVLPYLASGSSIVQVASLAGFLPISTMAVYAASKAYVLSFSIALAVELEARGISVTTLCPGPVATEFFNVAADKPDYVLKGAVSSSLVVARTLRAARRKKTLILPTLGWKLSAFFVGLVPRRLLAKFSAGLM